MIRSYADDATRDVHYADNTRAARRVPKDLWPIARRKLNMIHIAHALDDLRTPPSNHLEKLRGEWAGFYSIRINSQWRIVFKAGDDGAAEDVRIVDYH